ncbi:hypothetical protein QUA03_12125 [Microcoleus sp. S36b_A4]
MSPADASATASSCDKSTHSKKLMGVIWVLLSDAAVSDGLSIFGSNSNPCEVNSDSQQGC